MRRTQLTCHGWAAYSATPGSRPNPEERDAQNTTHVPGMGGVLGHPRLEAEPGGDPGGEVAEGGGVDVGQVTPQATGCRVYRQRAARRGQRVDTR